MTSDEFTNEQLDENLHKWFKEKWVRFGPDGKIRGACARGDDSEGKPKCLPQKKAQNLGKKGRKYAASKKRREDPNPERRGPAKNVATKKKTNEDIPFNECPSCRGPIVHESMMNEKQDACYHKVKSRYKVWPSAYASGALVQCRKKGASNWGTGGKKSESSIMKGIVDEAGSAAQQAAIAISKKERGEKPKNVGETKAKPYVKPFIENGKQVGWKSSDGYHVKYWRLADSAKAKAYQHAKISPDEVQEDYASQFSAEKTPTVNPHAGIKDNQFRGAIGEALLSEMPDTSGPVGVQPGGWRRYSPKPAGQLDEEYLDEGVMQKIGMAAMAAALALVGAKANAEPVYVYQDVDGKFSAALSPQDIPNDAVRKLVVDTDDDSVAILKGNSKIPINLTPTVVNYIKQQAGIGKAKPVQAQPTPNQQTAPTQQEKSVAMLDKSSLVFTGYTVDEIKEIMTNDIETTYPDSEVEDKGRSLVSTRYNVQGKNFGATLMTALLKGGNGTMDVITRYNFTKMGDQIRVTPQQFYRMQNVFGQAEMVDGNPGGVVKSWNKYFNPEQFTKKSKKETKEDTSYAGGMGQGGNAGQSYRKFKPKSAGTFNEEELDEACWKGYHKEGNKKMFGKTYPNCVKNTNEEEQLDEKCWDTHKQVGMKTKGGKSVPNCVPKESAIMKGMLGRD